MDEKEEIKVKPSCLEMKDIYEKCMKEKKANFELCFPYFNSLIFCGLENPEE